MTTVTTVATVGGPRPQSAFSRWANRHRRWLFAAPSMIFIALLIAFPIVWTFWLSLTDASGSVRAPASFIGLENYVTVLTDTKRFWPAVGRTAFFTTVVLFFEMLFGLGIALLLWRPFRGERWVRIAILLPLVATPVAVGMMWRLIFDPTIGPVNRMLGVFGMFMDIWQWTPMVALIILAGLTSLSDEPFEAARVDGASGFQTFRYITAPMLRSTLIVALMLRGIDALKTFDILLAAKGKGGGSFNEVETLNLYGYGLSFDYNEYGASSTVLILFFFIIVGSIFVLTRKREEATK